MKKILIYILLLTLVILTTISCTKKDMRPTSKEQTLIINQDTLMVTMTYQNNRLNIAVTSYTPFKDYIFFEVYYVIDRNGPPIDTTRTIVNLRKGQMFHLHSVYGNILDFYLK